jgi:hypothetical protein
LFLLFLCVALANNSTQNQSSSIDNCLEGNEIETPRLPCRSIWTKGQLWPPKLRVYALYECRDAGEEGWQVEISQKLLMPSAKADARGTRRHRARSTSAL